MQPIQLTIPTPCHEDWDKMTQNQQGRFCGSCAKTVVDFSAMTDAQLIFYFENLKNENVCGRVYPDQLNRPIEKAAPITSRKKTGWLWQYAAAFLVFFTKGIQAKAQGEIQPKVAIKGDTLHQPQPIRLGGIRRVNPEDVCVLPTAIISQLFITDENDNPVTGASVQLLPSKKWMTTDSTGKINLGKTHSVKEVKISATGFESKQVMLKDVKGNSVPINRKIVILEDISISSGFTTRMPAGCPSVSGTMVVGELIIQESKSRTISPVIAPAISDISFNVFPNPVQKGKEISFTVTAEKKKDYKILIADANGKIMLQQNYSFNTKGQPTSISIPVLWSSGAYIISLVDKNGETIRSEKIVLL